MFKKVVALFCATVMVAGTAIPTFAVGSPTVIYQSIGGTAVTSVVTEQPVAGGLTDTTITELNNNVNSGEQNAFQNALQEAAEKTGATIYVDGKEVNTTEALEGYSPIESDPFSREIVNPGTMTFAADSFEEKEAPVVVVLDDDGKVIGIFHITYTDGAWTANITMTGRFTIATKEVSATDTTGTETTES